MKFNIGCGKRNFGKDWIHIDGEKYDHINSHDIFLKEYENNIADLIYSSHMIEYFDREDLMEILKDGKKFLNPMEL